MPPTFLASFLTDPPPLPGVDALGGRWLNGGDSFDHEHPVHVGDTLTSHARLTDVTVKEGTNGPLALVGMTTEFMLDDGTVAVRHHGVRVFL